MSKILIVDDSAVVRIKLRKILEKYRHDIVAEATKGGDAIKLYKIHKPDIMTMDIEMPDMNGFEAMQSILSFDPDAKVIIVSTSDKPESVIHAVQKGAKDYLVKPFEELKVMQTINKLL
jgi:two-component system chemotaxis response regulator CheY